MLRKSLSARRSIEGCHDPDPLWSVVIVARGPACIFLFLIFDRRCKASSLTAAWRPMAQAAAGAGPDISVEHHARTVPRREMSHSMGPDAGAFFSSRPSPLVRAEASGDALVDPYQQEYCSHRYRPRPTCAQCCVWTLDHVRPASCTPGGPGEPAHGAHRLQWPGTAQSAGFRRLLQDPQPDDASGMAGMDMGDMDMGGMDPEGEPGDGTDPSMEDPGAPAPAGD